MALVARGHSATIAWHNGRPVSTQEFLRQVHGTARELPVAPALVNLCEDRYRFLIGFAAALVRGIPTLLPPNPLSTTVDEVQRVWPGSVVLSDTSVARAMQPPAQAPTSRPPELPAIPGSQLAAVLFTSGSTGASQPQPKSWAALSSGAHRNLRAYVGSATEPFSIVATVPPQHMYGLEATVMLALFGQAAAHNARPFYPPDVVAALAEVPPPRMLVSTPVHLSALIRSGLAFPPLARVVSATAPLDAALAASVERQFCTELLEIYGCTEIGSMAARRTGRAERWRFFEGLEVSIEAGSATVSAAHLAAPVRLPDVLEFHADGSFALIGRSADLIKVGGKRGSLADLTGTLLAIPGVLDATVFQPESPGDEGHTAALYVSDTIDVGIVRAALRRTLDPVFVPRPILRVPALPRSANGKLPRSAVLELYRQSLAASRGD
ncbi:MAG: acyl-CoA synthetase [Gammaproteobacteria bacterium]|nr:acyl-CoA synthetase [Gammaproteobacteria bacterium]